MTRRIVLIVGVPVVAVVLLVLVSYDIIGVDFTSFMEDQPSIDYQQGPRRLVPDEAVPLSRPSYLDMPATMANPVPADEVSLQRGAILFSLNCAVCHGSGGHGDGPVTAFWRADARRPADLTDPRISQYPAGLLYRVVTQGLGGMPPLRENMSEREYWDVINYVQSLSVAPGS
jgi:mono/diheme cytochrome c family protein